MRVIPLILLVLAGCAREGDNNTYVQAQPCQVLEDKLVCHGEIIEKKEQECSQPSPEKEVIVVEKEVVVEVPVEDTTATEVPPVYIQYHGVVCSNIPVVSLNNKKYVMYGGKLNIIRKGPWTIIWERAKNGKTSGCYVKINNSGKVKSRYNP